ncbi:unnamed protein product, partial [Vitis vinifera]|uniref:Beta-glucosidase 12 n=1 Tax=Vitis vinifera TaxID=29760 RepID=D7T2U8_VITVI
MLLAHAAAVKVYKDKYQSSQQGKIRITLICHWIVPYSNQTADKKAAKRAIDFMFGWFMDPLNYGNYPHSMHLLFGNRLPNFTFEQSMLMKGSLDFLGLNYYTANYAADIPVANILNVSYATNPQRLICIMISINHLDYFLPIYVCCSTWLSVYPRGIHNILLYIKRKYNNPLIYITKNGFSEVNNSALQIKEALKGPMRIDYHYRHLLFLQLAIKDGVNVKGYFTWSLLDNYE